MLLRIEPKDVEVTAPLLEFEEKRLDDMNPMKQLETICSRARVSIYTWMKLQKPEP
jgi:hypothetical protein